MNNSHLLTHSAHQVVAWYKNKPVTAKRFLSDVLHIIDNLPTAPYVVNLCDDRYHFMVGFAASILSNQVTLLPPSGVPGIVNDLAEEYQESYCITDRPINDIVAPQLVLKLPQEHPYPEKFAIPNIENERLIAVLFTSGSTGTPKPNLKYWGDLQIGAAQAVRRFDIRAHKIKSLVATVPPQHMYGLETSILIPWFGGIAVHSGRPLFPADVRDALATVDTPRILITTPIHLRACIAAEIKWPPIDFMISATASLSSNLAQETERQLLAPALEIYGCTEAGSIASRRTIEGDKWQLYDQMSLSKMDTAYLVHGPQLPEPIPLNDHLELLEGPFFKLLGRHTDMVKIAGKRASLGDLNHKLVDIKGVEDGAFVFPASSDNEVRRLTALVVAPKVSKKHLLKELAKSVDSAFLPRPLYKVDKLPRKSTGKLPHDLLQQMIAQLQKSHKAPHNDSS